MPIKSRSLPPARTPHPAASTPSAQPAIPRIPRATALSRTRDRYASPRLPSGSAESPVRENALARRYSRTKQCPTAAKPFIMVVRSLCSNAEESRSACFPRIIAAAPKSLSGSRPHSRRAPPVDATSLNSEKPMDRPAGCSSARPPVNRVEGPRRTRVNAHPAPPPSTLTTSFFR